MAEKGNLPVAKLSGWGRYQPAEFPMAFMRGDGRLPEGPFHCRGMGRSYGDASLPAAGGVSLDTCSADKFLDFEPLSGLLEAEPGVNLKEILRYFIPKGFFLPVTPGTKLVTLGGAVASNVHGKNHHLTGSIENFVEGLEVRTPTGTHRCSRTEMPDLFFATVGGYGLTGLISRIQLRLRPIRTSRIQGRNIRARSLEEMFRLFREHDAGYEFSVAWMDTLAKGRSLGRGIAMFGNFADRGNAEFRTGPGDLLFRESKKVSIPVDMPGFFLQSPFLRAFNALYYAINAPGEAGKSMDYDAYFYPLDRILDWNKAYGKAGFLQYQCVIPDPLGEEGVTRCLEFLSREGIGSFLTVLKRCGDDTVALPFCKRGYTLAMDIPFRGEATLKALERLDEIVLKYSGRVYLTKDARLSPDMFRAMYPEHRAWLDVVARYNPERLNWSRMAERLRL